MKKVVMFLLSMLAISVNAAILSPGDVDGLYLHLDADSIGLADGAAVTSWTDSAGGYEFTGTATYDTSYANGHGAVAFNGISDMLSNTSLVSAPSTANVTLFVVGNFTTADNDDVSDYLISGQWPEGTTDNRFRLIKYKNDSRYQFRVGDGGTVTLADTADAEQHVFTIVSGQSGNSVNFLIDDVLTGSGSSGSTPDIMQALGLGGYVKGNNQFADCSIAEVLLYDSALTTEQVSDVNEYLQAKYVPEPATMILLGMGSLLGLKRRK